MQGRGRFFIILGVVLLALAIVGGLLIVVLQGQGRPSPTPPPSGGPEAQATEVAPETRDVVVALQNIGLGEKIRPDAVGVRPVELDKLPEQPIRDPADVVGKLARQDIYQKDVLVADMVIAVEDVQRLGWRASPLIETPRVAIAFPVSQLSSVNYAIQPGDRVDVLVCGAFIDVDPDTQIKTPLAYAGDESCQAGCQVVGEQVQRTFCQLTVDDAEVLGIGLWGQTQQPAEEEQPQAEGEEVGTGQLPKSFDSIILMVTDQDAVVLKYFLQNNFVIDLALRSVEDTGRHETEQVTLEYIMTRFRISSPTKLPYRLESIEQSSEVPAPPLPPSE
jgi:Flp pilus assembly protein CpaB